MEMIQIILDYSRVHTDIVFVNIPTWPLELRSGTERCSKSSTIEDGEYLEIDSIIIREKETFLNGNYTQSHSD